MARPGPLVALALLLAAAGAATAVVLLHREAAPAEPLAHARAPADERPTEGFAAVEAASPSRTLEELLQPPAPAESPDAAGPGPLDVDDEEETALCLEFTPTRSQVDQLRRMDEAARTAFARQLSFGLAMDRLKDARLREFIETRMARSEKRRSAALTRMYAAKDAALAEKARDVAVGLRPDDVNADLPGAIARSRVTTRDGTIVRVVVREGDFPELDRARAAYEKLRDRRIDVVLAIFDLVLATAR